MRFVFVLLTAAACSNYVSPSTEGPLVAREVSPFAQCTSETPAAVASGEFDHWSTELFAYDDPDHIAADLLSTREGALELSAKFTYGLLSKDLEDEAVELWIDDCAGGARLLGTGLTDDDGRASLAINADALEDGDYLVTWRVVGDGTLVSSTLRLREVGTRVVVFDIDGTLTTSDSELFKELLDSDYIQQARAGATDTLWARADQGYELLFMTGRPYYLSNMTRTWLDYQGMPKGTLMLTQDSYDALPIDSGVGTFKANTLIELMEQGFIVDAAYGNATTDIYAYELAGVAQSSSYIMGAHGGEAGTVNGGEDFLEHLATTDFSLIEQP